MSIKCVTFDLDDTLWDCEPVLARAEAVLYDWLACNYPRVVDRYSAGELTAHRKDYVSRYPQLQHDITLLRKQWLTFILTESDYDPESVETGFKLFWLARNEVALFEGVRQVLNALQGVYLLGAITNGNADVYHIGIGHYFDFVVTAAEAGVPKPNARIFQLALAKGRVRAEETVHVGDDPQRDVMGAGAVGMRTVWINPHRRAWDGTETPDAVISSVTQLGAVLESWT
ncbi:MAG: HAD family hydrolase [Gammaproteobacteria bacterium]